MDVTCIFSRLALKEKNIQPYHKRQIGRLPMAKELIRHLAKFGHGNYPGHHPEHSRTVTSLCGRELPPERITNRYDFNIILYNLKKDQIREGYPETEKWCSQCTFQANENQTPKERITYKIRQLKQERSKLMELNDKLAEAFYEERDNFHKAGVAVGTYQNHIDRLSKHVMKMEQHAHKLNRLTEQITLLESIN